MTEYKTELTPKQARAVGFLITSRTIAEAAKLSEVSERTLYSWLGMAEFRDALRSAEKQTVENATRRLIAGQGKALDALEALITRGRNEGVRRAAAMDWLGLVLKFRDLTEIEARLSALEKQARNGK